MQLFEKYNFVKNDTCMCKDSQGLFIAKVRLGRYVALAMMLIGMIFLTGYFVGQRTAIERFVTNNKQESFADQLYYSMCSLYDQPDVDENDDNSTISESQEEESSAAEAVGSESVVEESEPVKDVQQVSAEPSIHLGAAQQSGERYYVQLVGFGTEKAAKEFAEKLKRKGIAVAIDKRISRTVKGKSIEWYQVISNDFADKDAAQQFIARVKRYEMLHDVRIVKK